MVYTFVQDYNITRLAHSSVYCRLGVMCIFYSNCSYLWIKWNDMFKEMKKTKLNILKLHYMEVWGLINVNSLWLLIMSRDIDTCNHVASSVDMSKRHIFATLWHPQWSVSKRQILGPCGILGGQCQNYRYLRPCIILKWSVSKLQMIAIMWHPQWSVSKLRECLQNSQGPNQQNFTNPSNIKKYVYYAI